MLTGRYVAFIDVGEIHAVADRLHSVGGRDV
jgi:hypothetical protein